MCFGQWAFFLMKVVETSLLFLVYTIYAIYPNQLPIITSLHIPKEIPSFWLPTLQFWTQNQVQNLNQHKSLWMAFPFPPQLISIRVSLVACNGMILISYWMGFSLYINRSNCIFVVGDNNVFFNTGDPSSTKEFGHVPVDSTYELLHT